MVQSIRRELNGAAYVAGRTGRYATGKTYTSVNIVGGGCQDMYLNQMTAGVTGLPVYAGSVEGTAIGNLIMQMIAAGEFDSLQAARDAVRNSFNIKEIKP